MKVKPDISVSYSHIFVYLRGFRGKHICNINQILQINGNVNINVINTCTSRNRYIKLFYETYLRVYIYMFVCSFIDKN